MGLEGERALIRALRKEVGSKPYSSTAKVSRVASDGRAWVRIDGADSDTPVAATGVECSPGDVVDISVSHKGTRITGNRTSPAATVRTVREVEQSVIDVKKSVYADFVKAEEIEAQRAVIAKLRAEFAEVGDLDVTGILTLKGTIRQIDQSLTEAMNSVWGHYEEATDSLRDDEGNLVLDEDGNAIPVIRKVWVTDADVIAERLRSDPSKWTGLAYNEAALTLAQSAMEGRLEGIEAGVRISDDPDDPRIEIGREGSLAVLSMTNDSLVLAALDAQGNTVHSLRMRAEATVAERFEVTNYMKCGRYAWTPRLDGSLSFQYVG